MAEEGGKKQSPRRSRLLRAGRILVFAAVLVVALGAAASWGIEWFCRATPPTLERTPDIVGQRVEEADGRRRLGRAWIARRQGILRMYLEGDPFTLGYCNAALTQEYIREQEASLIRTVKQYVPSDLSLWALRKLVLLRNRDLSSYIARRYKLEIYGLSRGGRDPFPELGPLYSRLLNYHAAHDISHAYMDHPLVGCTSFAAWGEATRDGHLLVGRNFDFAAGRCFDENKVVVRVKPDEGLGFISVSWPGLVGVVTGINDARIVVSVNAAQSSDTRRIGTPVSIVVRDVMQHAATLQEAVDTIRKSQVFVADCYLVADGKTGEAVVVERTPLEAAVRRGSGNYIICSNHFLSGPLGDDEGNVGYVAKGTSAARYDRMEALVAGSKEPLTPEAAAAILRDRVVPGVAAPVLGHQAAINSITATHSVVVDATAGIIWVSASPHQLGAYVPFGLERFENPPGAADIPPDPLLADGSYKRCVDARSRLERAARAIKTKDWEAAATDLREAAKLAPNLYLPHLLLGRVAVSQEKWAEAKEHLEKARALYPAFGHERTAVQNMIEKCTAQGEKLGASRASR